MATRGSFAEFNNLRLTHRGYFQLMPLPLASQRGSATRNNRRRPRRMLRLRCAPPSASSNAIHAKASKSGHLKRSFSSPPVASAAGRHARQSEQKRRTRQSRPAASCERRRTSCTPKRAKAADAAKPPHRQFRAPQDIMHTKASKSGHLKRSFSSPPVASAPIRERDYIAAPFSASR